MNKHVKALLIKFVGSFFLLYIILGLIYGMEFGEVLLLSAVLGVAAYLIGDMIILPKTNNFVATLADFVLAGIIIYVFVGGLTTIDNVFTVTLLATIGVALFEVIFHRYLQNFVLPNEESKRKHVLQYQTEMSGELKVDRPEKKKEDNQNK
ncbi:YndM family protein [Oceanobacillus sp. CAU 1775]